jgi:hypothetical protein
MNTNTVLVDNTWNKVDAPENLHEIALQDTERELCSLVHTFRTVKRKHNLNYEEKLFNDGFEIIDEWYEEDNKNIAVYLFRNTNENKFKIVITEQFCKRCGRMYCDSCGEDHDWHYLECGGEWDLGFIRRYKDLDCFEEAYVDFLKIIVFFE